MKDIQLLIKKNNQESRYNNVYPKTYTDAVIDKESNKKLSDILNSFNMYLLSYNGSIASTRLQVPNSLRKTGLWITYVKYDKSVITETYIGDKVDNDSWLDNSNWDDKTHKLVISLNMGTSETLTMSLKVITNLITLLSDRITALENK